MTASPDQPNPRIGGLDALRGLAALAVFVCHLGGYWGSLGLPKPVSSLLAVGAHGVDVFVVLSGFVLMLPLVSPGRTLNTGQFYGRRMWRILPAYWAALAFATVLAIAPTWPLVVAQQATPWDVVVHALGLQTLFVPTLGAINGSLWSISLELSLYLVFPVLIVALHRLGATAILIGSIALCLVWGWAGSFFQLGGPLEGFIGDGHTLPMRLVQFVVGMLFAVLLHRRRHYLDFTPRNRTMSVIVAASTTIAATAASTWEAPEAVNICMWSLAGAALVWCFAVFSPVRAIARLDSPGRRAYSFYLVHQPIVLLFAPLALLMPGDPVVALAVVGFGCFVLVCLLAELLYRTVEKPSHLAAVRRYPRPVERHARQEA